MPRFAGGRKVAAPLQRMRSDDLLASVFPDQVACAENLVGEREIPQHPLVQQTLTDPLTGAYNRRHLAQQLALLARPDAAALGMNALLAIDIDHFKSINDHHGHAAGDAALVAMVAAL